MTADSPHIDSLTPSAQPQRVAIVGSCVTRDAFAHHVDVLGQPAAYFARTVLASALDARPFRGVDTSTIESPFQRRMVEQDLTGALRPFLVAADFDLLIYDLIDERFEMYVAEDHARATRSMEFQKATFDGARAHRIRPRTDEFFDLWKRSWVELVTILDRSSRLGLLRINRVYWATKTSSGADLPAKHRETVADETNSFMDRMYKRMSEDLPVDQFYRYEPELLLAADDHRWGVAPFHYGAPYYEALTNKISSERPGGLGGVSGVVRESR